MKGNNGEKKTSLDYRMLLIIISVVAVVILGVFKVHQVSVAKKTAEKARVTAELREKEEEEKRAKEKKRIEDEKKAEEERQRLEAEKKAEEEKKRAEEAAAAEASKPKFNPSPGHTEGEKIVFLTFDDGPSIYTSELLKILDRNGVKATFFVTGAYPGCKDNIGAAYRAGHAIGAHTYTHNFSEIYSSDEAFWNDMDRIQNLIEQETGQKTKMIRFAGGSSNTVSRRYNRGIMTRLVSQAAEKGYQYFDWNVSSGDAGETTDSNKVAENIVNGVSRHSVSVVLCHDTKKYTVEGIEKAIKWCLDNGYEFRTLTPDSFAAHHGVNN